MPTAAEQDWNEATERCDRTHQRRGAIEPFRRYHGAAALIYWYPAFASIAKLEAGSETGSAGRLLDFLKSIADKHRLSLTGMVTAYETDERPVADQGRVIAFYRHHGFYVGPAPLYTLRYPPPSAS